MCLFSKIVRKKEKAYKKGTAKIFALKNDISSQIRHYGSQIPEYQNKFIGPNVLEVMNAIYNNNNFYDYLKYSFLAKHYERIIILIQWLVILFFLLLGFVSYLIFGIGKIFVILVVVLLIILLFVFLFLLRPGEKYSSYYQRTWVDLLLNIYNNLVVCLESFSVIDDVDIETILNQKYNRKIVTDNATFIGSNSSGKLADLKLIREIKTTNKEGHTNVSTNTIFDGFCFVINVNYPLNMLRGNVIEINNDENLFSSLTEDTFKGIYESQYEISFNSEEMNKSFDGRISGYSGFDTVDDVMIQVQKILTPSFEQHLLYLRDRYNTFNMHISDNGLILFVNMKRSLFQQSKHNELLDFSTSYREANQKVKMIKADLNGIDDFAYYNVFPVMEKIYLINYLTYLYLSYMNFDNYYSVNNTNINNFEESMKNVYTMKNKEFRELYTDKIKEIKNNTKEFKKEFENESEVETEINSEINSGKEEM